MPPELTDTLSALAARAEGGPRRFTRDCPRDLPVAARRVRANHSHSSWDWTRSNAEQSSKHPEAAAPRSDQAMRAGRRHCGPVACRRGDVR